MHNLKRYFLLITSYRASPTPLLEEGLRAMLTLDVPERMKTRITEALKIPLREAS